MDDITLGEAHAIFLIQKHTQYYVYKFFLNYLIKFFSFKFLVLRVKKELQ